MTELKPGGNTALGQGPWTIEVVTEGRSPVVDAALYLLRPDGKVAGDEGMVFYGQPRTPDSRITFHSEPGLTRFVLAGMPSGIERMALTAVGEDDADLSPVRRITVRAIQAGRTMASFQIDTVGRTERALILAEIYDRNGEAKIRSVCQGFNGGLRRLSEHYGVEVTEPEAVESVIAPPPPPPVRRETTTVPDAPGTGAKKVSLQKNGVVSLKKGGGSIKAMLRWQGRGGGDGDLDFYCYTVDRDGRQSKAYWHDLGSAERHPYVEHQGDSRRAGEETIVIHRPDELRYALFAAYSAIGNGAGSFASYRPEVVITDQKGSEVIIPLLNDNHTSYWVAITHLSFGEETRIEHVETYGAGGLRFIAAEKSPQLHADGTWDVSKGIIEFKR